MATMSSIVGLHCGDRVEYQPDPRHVGTVLAVIAGEVRVKWDDTTWISDEDRSDLRRIG